MNTIFAEIGVIIIVAAAFALLSRLFRLPPLVGYILTGVTLGPIGAKYLQSPETLDAMKQIGIALLLFLIGLELDWVKARHMFKTASTLALIQAVGSFAAGMVLALIGNQSVIVGVYLGAALAFSSTVIVVKFLSESRDLNSLHGRLAVGILLVQDIIALVALAVVSGFSDASSLSTQSQILLLVVKTIAALSVIWVMAEHILPFLFAKIARSAELLFLASLAWCFLFTLSLHRFDFPLEMGAFLAGISLAALPYSVEILNRLRSLRDFFVILFFVSLGSSLVIPTLPYALLTAGLVVITVIVKPFITFITLTASSYRARTAFLTAITQSQLSEFSLIIVALGVSQGYISNSLSSSITFTAIVTTLISTILFTSRLSLFRRMRRVLRLMERRDHSHEHITDEMEERLHDHIVIFGYHRMGYHILKKIQGLHNRIVIVDFNPDIIRKLRAQQVDCIYGDAEDEEIFELVKAEKASLLVSTIPHREETTFFIEHVKAINKHAKIIVTAHNIDDALHYYHLGVDYVILPHLLGGEHVANLIIDYHNGSLGKEIRHQAEELKLLRTRNHALYYD